MFGHSGMSRAWIASTKAPNAEDMRRRIGIQFVGRRGVEGGDAPRERASHGRRRVHMVGVDGHIGHGMFRCDWGKGWHVTSIIVSVGVRPLEPDRDTVCAR